MNIIGEIQNFWKQHGFNKLQYNTRNIWIKEHENVLALVDIIPERLPGQPKIDVGIMEAEMLQLERKLMIQSGKKVDRLSLLLCQDLPDQDKLNDTMNCTVLWWLDWKHARIFIFENQRADFFGYRHELEEFIQRLNEQEKQTSRKELKRSFKPVTIFLVVLNILIFLGLNMTGDIADTGFMIDHGALSWELIIQNHQFYRFVTAMFLHFSPDHLLQNMLILMLTGSRLERAVGRIRYLCIYIGSGVLASAASVFFTLRGTSDIAEGASGAIFGIMGALVSLILTDTIRKKKLYFQEIGLSGIIFMIVCAASYGLFSTGIDNAAHFGGLAGGFVLGELLTIDDWLHRQY